MNQVTNADRAKTAESALHAYVETCDYTHGEESVADSLCDLMHFCSQEKIDFNRALQNAQWNFNEEVKDESK